MIDLIHSKLNGRHHYRKGAFKELSVAHRDWDEHFKDILLHIFFVNFFHFLRNDLIGNIGFKFPLITNSFYLNQHFLITFKINKSRHLPPIFYNFRSLLDSIVIEILKLTKKALNHEKLIEMTKMRIYIEKIFVDCNLGDV